MLQAASCRQVVGETLDIEHKYEHSDGAYSVHVAGALVLALVVVAV